MMQDQGSKHDKKQEHRKTQFCQSFCQIGDEGCATQGNQRVTDKEAKRTS